MNGIVVGVDGSPGAAGALHFAAQEARLRGTTLHVVCAWQLPPVADGGAVPELLEELEKSAREVAARAAEESGVPTEQHVFEGGPAEALLRAAEGADLLVVGTRGLGGFSRLVLGSVSHAVMQHPPCPVAVVPTPHDHD